MAPRKAATARRTTAPAALNARVEVDGKNPRVWDGIKIAGRTVKLDIAKIVAAETAGLAETYADKTGVLTFGIEDGGDAPEALREGGVLGAAPSEHQEIPLAAGDVVMLKSRRHRTPMTIVDRYTTEHGVDMATLAFSVEGYNKPFDVATLPVVALARYIPLYCAPCAGEQ